MKMSATTLNAQVDTLFWFAAPWVTPDHNGNTPLAFRVSTFNNAATVRMQLPAGTFDTTFIVPANSLGNVDLSYIVNDLESKPADAILTSGMKITSDEMITVVYDFISISPSNPETYSLKGQNGMGIEFVVPFQTLWNNRTLGGASPLQPKQFFSVVATEDNTTIYIKPNAAVVGHPADVTYAVFLPLAGNAYTCENIVQSTSDPGSSLSGSIVTANKPISVVMNDDSVNPSGGGGCFDLMGDQIVPTDVIGNEYIVNIGGLNAGSNESIFIIPAENFTTITVTDGGVTTQLINQGETWQYSITDLLTHVIADKPVYLIHMSGYGCELGIAILPPLNCSGSDEVSFARNNSQPFSLNLLCEAGDEFGFSLTAGGGGTGVINPALFNTVPGTGGAWVGTQIAFTNTQLVSGFQNTLTNSMGFFSMGVINGGATSGCLYHYMSSFNRKVITDAGTDTTVCNGEPVVNLNGSVIGGTTTGFWQVLDGTGTLNNPTNLITTYDPSPGDYTQGFVTFVLSSSGNCEPVRDTVRVDYIQSPVTGAGVDDSYCKNNIGAIPVSGTVQFAAGASWSGGGGAFANPGSLTTTYTPSAGDLTQDSVVLYLTSAGSLFACPDDQDTVIIYLTPAPLVIPGASLVLCSSETVINLNGSVTGATTDGTWTTTGFGGFSPTADNPVTDYNISAGDISAGTIYLTLTSTGNGSCLPEEDSIQVTFLDEPIVDITANDSVCSNLSLLDLNGTVSFGFTSLWTTGGFGSIVAPASLTTQYNITSVDTTQGYVDVYLASNPGICPSVLDSMRIYFVDPPDANAGIDQNYCENQVIQLNGSVTGVNNTGSWTTMGTGSFSPSPNLLITNYVPSPGDLTNGSVTLILTSTSVFGCPPDVSTMTVTFLETPTADFTATTSCEGDNTVFTDQSTSGSGTINYWSWNFGNSGTSIVQNPIHTYSGSGTYNATLIAGSDNGCYDTIIVPVQINPVPIADFNPTVACEDTPIDFVDLSFISSGAITDWLYDFGGATSTSQNPSYTFANTGFQVITLTVTSDLGCVDDTLLTLNVTPAPIADFSFTPNPALVNETVAFTDLSTGSNINQWYWDFGDNEANNVQNPVHSYSEGGDYIIILEVTDELGCTDTTSKVITIALPPVLPTGFTPNGDGENDVFWIRGGPFEAVVFNIYNNWGELIFTSNENDYISSWEDLGWNGMYNGEPAPMGVYTWTFVVRMANDQLVKDSGDVTLIR
ncbi:MAG: gliding motility-associated-like protein [Salibacteraceae bacterium]|jgi:gliding motility-associated-like protein